MNLGPRDTRKEDAALERAELEIDAEFHLGLIELGRFLACHLAFTIYLERTGQA